MELFCLVKSSSLLKLGSEKLEKKKKREQIFLGRNGGLLSTWLKSLGKERPFPLASGAHST